MRKLSVILFACLLAACGTPSENTQEHNCADCKDKNVVVETIMARRSIRNYEERPVNRDTMNIIAECGINAANAMNAQKWEVRLVDDPEFINGISALYVNQMKQDPRGARMVLMSGQAADGRQRQGKTLLVPLCPPVPVPVPGRDRGMLLYQNEDQRFL